MKKIAIFGSTGSIGKQAIDIVCQHKDKYKVTSLACNSNIQILKDQIQTLRPETVFVASEKSALEIKKLFPKLEVLNNRDELVALSEQGNHDLLLNSLVGISGLEPTVAAIKGKKEIALANKESLVAGGSYLMAMAEKNKVSILPVDSEHSAIFQSLLGNKRSQLRRIILTASGGPFRKKSIDDLEKVRVADALKHPNWSMGSKITIDSATLMNKGLEVIEAAVLFNLNREEIHVVVHPQSIFHSGVEYIDGSVIAQLGRPDMRGPISFALSYPDRLTLKGKSLDFFTEGKKMTFEPIDNKVFKTVDLAFRALEEGLSHQIVLNAANEELVKNFLQGKIGFLDIQKNIEKSLDEHKEIKDIDLDKILQLDKEVRFKVNSYFK